MRGTAQKSNVRSFCYDAEKEVLTVEFHAGGLCEYFGVPAATFRALEDAVSRDRYFDRNIRFRFRHRHILKI